MRTKQIGKFLEPQIVGLHESTQTSAYAPAMTGGAKGFPIQGHWVPPFVLIVPMLLIRIAVNLYNVIADSSHSLSVCCEVQGPCLRGSAEIRIEPDANAVSGER